MAQTRWQERLRSSGHRLTPQRELVLAAVEELRHATPEQVYDEVRRHSAAINLSTIYRTLELLDRLGLISHAHIEERTPTYHAVSDHQHFHLVCHSCRAVISVGPAVVAPLVEQVRAEHGFSVDVGHLSVFGLCADCVAAGEVAAGEVAAGEVAAGEVAAGESEPDERR